MTYPQALLVCSSTNYKAQLRVSRTMILKVFIEQMNIKVKKEESSKDKSGGDFKDTFINEKLEWIKLKKKIEYICDINPLTLNIEGIYTLPEGIKVAEDDGTVRTASEENPFT